MLYYLHQYGRIEMPKSLTFLGNESDPQFKWEIPTYTVTINVLNNSVLQEILKFPGVELVDLHKLADTRPPIVGERVEDGIGASGTPSRKKKVKSKGNAHPTPYHDRFAHPSGKPAHWFLTQYLVKNGGQAGLAELKRALKIEGFSTGTAMGAMTKMVARGEAVSKKPHGYVLTDKGKEKADKESVR
jgi:hypothetical protein